MGALVVPTGDATVNAINTGGSVLLQFSSLTRSQGATVNFLTTGGANGTTNSIQPGVPAGFIDSATYFGGSSFAWYDTTGTGSVRGIIYSGPNPDAGATTSGTTASLGNATHQQITGAITAQTNATFTTFNITGSNNVTITAANTVGVNGLLLTGGTSTISGGTITAANNAEMGIRTDLATDSLTISSVIGATGTNSFTKSGAGTLTLEWKQYLHWGRLSQWRHAHHGDGKCRHREPRRLGQRGRRPTKQIFFTNNAVFQVHDSADVQ